LATQNEVISFIKSNYTVNQFEENIFGLRFDLGNDRSQMVIVTVVEGMIATSSPFARIGQITDSQALAESSILAPICKFGEFYVTSKSMMLETIDPQEITSIMAITCYAADGLEKKFGHTDEF
jgi:hypothetical protein